MIALPVPTDGRSIWSDSFVICSIISIEGAKTREKMKRKDLFILLLFGIVAIGVATVVYLNQDDLGIKTQPISMTMPLWVRSSPSANLAGRQPFDSKTWLSDRRKFGSYTRWLMLPDLREHHLGQLDNEANVSVILGPPDHIRYYENCKYLIYEAWTGAESAMKPQLVFKMSSQHNVERIATSYQHFHDAPGATPDYVRAFGTDWGLQGGDLN